MSSVPQSSGEIKNAIIKEVREVNAVQAARAMISKVNEHCFDRCIPKPGSSLSSSETTCVSSCVEKYFGSFNIVSRTVVQHMQAEGGMKVAGLIG